VYAVVGFAGVGLASVAVISIAAVLILRSHARDEAVRDARDVAIAESRAAVEPLLDDAVLGGQPGALAQLDDVVRHRVLGDRVVRVKVWRSDGQIIYSDESRLIGRRFALGPAELRALRSGQVHADLSDLHDAENRFERRFGTLLEVYVGLRAQGGDRVLFEAYLLPSAVAARERELLASLAPAVVGGLVVLFLLQLPLAWSFARRLEHTRAEREELLRRALEAGEHERNRLAADLHDAVVQHVAGAGFAVAGVAERIDRRGIDDEAATLRSSATRLRQAVRDLRTLIAAIAPPRLHEEGLAAALGDLVSVVQARGVEANFGSQTCRASTRRQRRSCSAPRRRRYATC
jgi:two-component system NarL family sensor kinase